MDSIQIRRARKYTNSVLLYGLPGIVSKQNTACFKKMFFTGTGKTCLIEQLAHLYKWYFVKIEPSLINGPVQGDPER